VRGLVILDGPDAVGKTTLAGKLLGIDPQQIQDNPDTTPGYYHLSYAPDRELWRLQYFTLYGAQARISMQNRLIVIDRHWPSELIYSRAFRDGTHMNAESRGWDRVIKRMCGLYVICAPNPDSAVERHGRSFKERTEMYKPSPIIRDVAQRYYDWWHGNPYVKDVDYITQITRNGGMWSRLDAMLYDIDKHGHDLNLVVAEITARLDYIQRYQYPPALDHRTMNFLGYLPQAKYLFVGERINPKKSGRWPFIDFGASSAAMSSVLHNLNFDESLGVWTNAIAADRHVQALLELKPELRVIALGNTAALELDKLSIPHDTVYHPSFAKRFAKMNALEGQLSAILNP
jgi:hypothetical protein